MYRNALQSKLVAVMQNVMDQTSNSPWDDFEMRSEKVQIALIYMTIFSAGHLSVEDMLRMFEKDEFIHRNVPPAEKKLCVFLPVSN